MHTRLSAYIILWTTSSLMLVSHPILAKDISAPVRLCVLSAAVNPVKTDGRPWDGPSWGKNEALAQTGRHIMSQLAIKSAQLLADLDPATALTTMAAKAGLEAYAAGTKAPDLKIRVSLGEEQLIQTKPVSDSIAPSYTTEHEHCSAPVRAHELRKHGIRIVVVDQDLSEDDMVGSLFRPLGFSRKEVKSRLIQLNRADFMVRLGIIDAKSAHDGQWRTVKSGRVTIDAGQTWTQTFQIDSPTRLMLDWSSVGVSSGLRRAMNDTLVAGWLADPGDKDVQDSRIEKKTRGHWVGVVREPGTYRLHLSNQGLTRISARRVKYRLKRQPVD